MMKYMVLFIAGLLSMQAQTYNPVVDGNVSLFLTDTENEYNGSIYALAVDSVASETEHSSYYFHKTMDSTGSPSRDCYNTYLPSWIGSKMLDSNETYYFFNQRNDTLAIKTSKEAGESWIFYRYENGDYVEASVVSKEQQTFLSVTDSVKTVSLQLKDASDTPLSSSLNGITLQFSKTYGALKLIPFAAFPADYSYYDLIGMTNPELGVQPLTSRKIYDYSIGDEFHYTEEQSDWTGNYNKKIVHVITDKRISMNTDTVIYTLQENKETHFHRYHPSALDTTYYASAVLTKRYLVSDSLIIPGSYITNYEDQSDWVSLKRYSLHPGQDPNGFLLLKKDSMALTDYEGCWNQLIDAAESKMDFKENCGYSYETFIQMTASYEAEMVYYKKGDLTFGEPLILSALKPSAANISLYPVPATSGGRVTLLSDQFNAIQWKLIDRTGNTVKEYHDPAGIERIDLSGIGPGLYVVQLINGKNEFSTSRIIVQ